MGQLEVVGLCRARPRLDAILAAARLGLLDRALDNVPDIVPLHSRRAGTPALTGESSAAQSVPQETEASHCPKINHRAARRRTGGHLRLGRSHSRQDLEIRHRKFDRERTSPARPGARTPFEESGVERANYFAARRGSMISQSTWRMNLCAS